jgi:hypothetical protein
MEGLKPSIRSISYVIRFYAIYIILPTYLHYFTLKINKKSVSICPIRFPIVKKIIKTHFYNPKTSLLSKKELPLRDFSKQREGFRIVDCGLRNAHVYILGVHSAIRNPPSEIALLLFFHITKSS